MVSKGEFNWKDGENHWENFLKYKEVFGDVELEVKGKRGIDNGSGSGGDLFEDCCDLGFGIDCDEFGEDGEEEDGDGEDNVGSEGEFVGEREFGDLGLVQARKFRKSIGSSKCFGIIANQVLELRDVVVRREEKRRERDFVRDEDEIRRNEKRKELELQKEKRRIEREERLEDREMALEERELVWARREVERRMKLEKELDEERSRRRRMEEKREEEEMKWRERLIGLQIEHEKAIMQMHVEASQNQMQILGIMARFFCQFFGSANDGLGPLPPQVLQNLQHPGGLNDNGKPDDTNSPPDFM